MAREDTTSTGDHSKDSKTGYPAITAPPISPTFPKAAAKSKGKKNLFHGKVRETETAHLSVSIWETEREDTDDSNGQWIGNWVRRGDHFSIELPTKIESLSTHPKITEAPTPSGKNKETHESPVQTNIPKGTEDKKGNKYVGYRAKYVGKHHHYDCGEQQRE